MDRYSEREPLLPFADDPATGDLGDHHSQFCNLVGVRSFRHPENEPHKPHPQSLYARALKQRRDSSCTYMFTATLVNTLLLTQIVLGAALTGLGASDSSRILITAFGALNTIIAGVIAFLKSRGQPLRSRMFRDDLSRVVDEIENSAIMWYGISSSAHGYDAIDTDEQVTVRSEVARLTRLYDKAVKTNTMNDPDMYSAGTGDSYSAGLRKFVGAGRGQEAPFVPPVAATPQSPPAPIPDQNGTAPNGIDQSPASKAPESTEATPVPAEGTTEEQGSPTDTPKSETENVAAQSTPSGSQKGATDARPGPSVSSPAVESVMRFDPDESPASAARMPKKEDTSKSENTLVGTDGS
ncbi:hypothetical protein LIA77_10822 [Sarocladium implicatum]|nr:hypothetical protein LIA77_10822 [Sarocladium implicatum]